MSIPTAVDGCGRDFLGLASSLKPPSNFSDQLPVGLIMDEFDRFKLWAGNIAAHRKGRRSLENRLRDAAQLKADTLSQLGFFLTKTALAIVKGEVTPWDELEFSDSGSETSTLEGSGSELQGDTELKQLYGNAKTAVTSLMRISIAIREPAQSKQSRSIDKSHYERPDMQHVENKFPASPLYLCERLGLAITSRRQYLTYREEHHDKLTKGIEKLGLEAARTEFTTNSTEATNLQRTDSLNIMDKMEDTASMTSLATSANATLRAPTLPKEAREKEHYNCPYCYSLVNIHSITEWKRHVYQDLHPYCCTFEDCTTADRLYDSRHAWFAHELEAHRSIFRCVEDCSKTYSTEAEFEAHIKSKHDDLAAPDIYSAIKRTSVKRPSLSDMATCRLCERDMMLRVLQKHLGHHQEQLALFALPLSLDDAEDDPDEDVQDSQTHRHTEEELMGEASNASNESESEDFPDLGEEPIQVAGKDKERFCICNDVESGTMVFCDNDCEKKWFHLPCLGLTWDDISSLDKWYCPDCRKLKGTDASRNKTVGMGNINTDEHPREATAPSHEYAKYRQQTGLPSVSEKVAQRCLGDDVPQSPKLDNFRAKLEISKHGGEAERLGEIAEKLSVLDQFDDESERQYDYRRRPALHGGGPRVNSDILWDSDENKENPWLRVPATLEDLEEALDPAVEAAPHQHELKMQQESDIDTDSSHGLAGKPSEEVALDHERIRTVREYAELDRTKESASETVDEANKTEEDMRKRLAEFGFEEAQVDAMMESESNDKGKFANIDPDMKRHHTVLKARVDVETLNYYDISYKDDGDIYFLQFERDVARRELDVLYEHTRRLREIGLQRVRDQDESQFTPVIAAASPQEGKDSSRKGLDKKFECPHEGCERRYSRAEHLTPHPLNHDPKQIYICDFPDCNRSFIGQDLYARHKLLHKNASPPLQPAPPDNAKENAMLEKPNDLYGKEEEERRKEQDARWDAGLAKFDRLDNLLFQNLEVQIDKDEAKKQAAEDAARVAANAKKKGDEDKLASLEKLISAQKDERLQRETAADAADIEAEKVVEEKRGYID
ncbi:hypothetical protein OPT61_g881 [Boeremia exigua]|uniref:Uncharacterized protein n=1 Tax=Boeremia exigua TaxID=749465 RepID=A0ACC2IS74_9PLEO|nr:hypothetical protein OPT61_g881 [Boeremia exigua]